MSSINRPTRKNKQSIFLFQQRTWYLFLHVISVVALSSFLVTAANAARLYAPAITATKTDTFVGGDGDGKADPGETIKYTVTINNSGTAATGVNYTDTIDANTTLVAGSTSASPAAADDTYPQTVIGNVSINSSLIPYSVVTNDYLGLNPSATISTFDATSTHGGTVTMTTSGAGIGQFTYDPPAGFTGTDTFTYTLSDNANATSASTNRQATVTLTVSGKVWFINNAAGACSTSCDGRLSHPFTTLGAFKLINDGSGLHPAANDNIFVYENAAAYTGGIILLNGQKLIGQDATASLSSITGLTPPSSSVPFPAMNPGAPAATIQNAISDGITIGEGNTIRGLTISGSNSAGIKGINKNALTVGSDVALTGNTGSDLDLSGGNGTIDFGASISNSAGRAVSIQNRSGGTITLSGSINDSGGTGVYLNSNIGATINFTGLLTLSTSGNDAFSALGGGTVSSTNTSSTLNTTTGTALKVTNTTIGASGLTFRSISSDGAPNGIYLNNTGSSGGLTVTGNGSAGTGGTIRNSTGSDAAGIIPGASENAGSGIFLYNTNNVALSWMQLNDHANFAIYGNTVNGFTLASSVISGSNGNNAAVDEGSVAFNGLTGVVSISNTFISGGWEDNFRVRNTSGSLNRITFNTVTIGANSIANGNAGILLDASGTAVLNTTVQSSTFTSSRGDLFHLNAVGNASSDLVFHTNTLSNNHTAIATGGGGVTIGAGDNTGTVNLTFNINGNTFRDANGHGVLIFKSTDPGTLQGTFSNNTIGVAAINNSGSIAGDGIKIQNAGLGTVTVKVSNNYIYQYNNYGIDLTTGGSASAMSGAFNATVTGNTISNPGTGGLPMNGIMLNGGTVVGDTYAICTDIGGAGALANTINGSGIGGGTDVRLRQRQATTVRLPGYGGANNDNAAVQTYLSGRNITAPTALASNNVPTGGGFVGGASCAQPIAMEPGNSQILAQAQPENTASVAAAVSAGQSASDWSKLVNLEAEFATTLPSNVQNSIVNTNIGGGKPLFDIIRPATAQSGETVTVNIGDVPANKSVTVTFLVTVNSPQLPLGTSKITNQGTVHSNELADVLTTNGGAVDCETGSETCTPVDRPDTPVSSITRVGSTPTNAASVSWTVTFANPISGLTSSNFVLGPTGLGGTPAITSVTAVGGLPAASWTVVASTGTGDGSLGLSLSSDAGLSHDVTNLIFIGQVYNIDRTVPTITNITSTSNSGCLLNGGITYCNATDVVHISVTFSEAVNVTGAPQLALNSGGTASYASGAGTNTLIFDYTVASGQDVSDLDYSSTNALTLNGGTIQDAATNNATLTLASPGAAGSLGFNANIDIDTAAPMATSFNRFNPSTTPTNADTLVWQAVFSEKVSGVDGTDFSVPALTGETILTSGSADTYNVTVSGGDLANFNGPVNLDFAVSPTITDLAGNPLTNTVVSFDQHYVMDNTAPTVSMTSAAGNPTNASPIPVTITFSESVTSFTSSNITPGNGTVSNFAGSGANYTFDLVPSGQGPVTADIAAGVAPDDAGNPNTAATQFSRTYDSIAPTVTINQAIGQSDPTNASTINFTVVFSEPVGSSFATGDVNLSSSTAPGTLIGTVTEVAPNNGTTYNVAVSGMTGDGLVIASIQANKAQDLAGNTNTASTSSDNSVLYDTVPPSVTINQASGQPDPTSTSPINFTVVFSETVTDFNDTSDVTLSGTAGATTVSITEIAPNNGTTYNVAVSGMTSFGTVIASIPAGVAADLASQLNTASTSTDHTVTYLPPTDLAITKTDGVTTAIPGGSVTYTITASNAGPNNAVGATVADTFPASLTANWTCVGAGGGTCTASGSGNINDTVNLPVGGSVTYTASAVINSAATGNLSNTATVTAPSNVTDTNSANNSATDTDTLVPQANLAITKTDGVLVAIAGNSVTYTITASNAGPSNASGATVADTLPASLTANWTCVGAGGGTCTASGSGNINNTVNLPAGGSVTYTVNAAVNPAATGTLSNTATISAPGGVTDPDSGNNSATDNDALIPPVNVTINKASGQADPANTSPINFTVVFASAVTGFADASDVTLSGTAGPTTIVITEIAPNDGTTYNVAVSGMTGNGNVTATIPANVATGSFGQKNAASTSTDNSVLYDTVKPTVTINQAGAQADPTNSSPINFTVVFSEPVTGFVTGDVDLSAGTALGTLTGTVTETGPMDGTTYNVAVSGMGSDGTIIASIPAGVAQDAATNTNVASTSTDHTVTFDTTPPTAPVVITPANGSMIKDNTPDVSGTAEASASISVYIDGTPNGATPANGSGNWLYPVLSALTEGSHTVKARATDAAGNTSADSNTNTFTVDTVEPDTTITLNPPTPSNSASAIFSFTGNGTGTPVAGFECRLDSGSYTSCSSPQTYSSLTEGSHTFYVRATDGAGNVDSTPASYPWVVDLTGPDTILSGYPNNPTNSTTASFTFTGNDNGGSGVASFECSLDSGTYTSCSSPQTYTGLSNGNHTVDIRAIDNASLPDPSPAHYAWKVDLVAPTVTINQAGTQADPTNAASINFTVVFSEPVTGFASGDVNLSAGTATGTLTDTVTEIAPNDGTTYNVAVSGMTGDGTVIASIQAGKAQDTATNNNAASTSTDNIVTYDSTAPTVTINQAIGQPDPAGSSPVNFTVVFSEPVTGFATGDVDLSAGTAPGTLTSTVTEIAPMDGTTYNVAVSGMTGDGTVIASIQAGKAQDAATNANIASTSTDNSVLYDTIDPSVTINQSGTQVDPTNVASIDFTVVFSEPVTGFATGDVDLSAGTAAGALTGAVTEIAPMNGTTYNVTVTGMTGDGTVIASIQAGKANDLASRPNTASTSTDNSVIYDTTAPAVTTFTATSPAISINIPITAFTASDAVGVTGYMITESATAPTANAAGWSQTIPNIYTVASSGTYTLYPWAKDAAGNVSAVFGTPRTVIVAEQLRVSIAGSDKGDYGLIPGQSTRQSYAANGGPVRIGNLYGTNIIASERTNYFISDSVTSYSEMMGLPNGQLDTTYWFPWYKNDSQVNTQLRIGNVSGTTAHVHVYIAGTEMAGSPYTLTATGDTQSTRLSYSANGGPVKIVSDQNIVAAERINYLVGGAVVSYSEMMGLPNLQLDNTYWFPWYKNDSTINTQLRIGNVSGTTAHVHVYIAGTEVTGSPYTLTATGDTQSVRLSYTTNGGPLKIVSDQNIVAAERVNYFVGGIVTSYSEMMGLPNNQLDTIYHFPWYKNDFQVNTQLRLANVSGSDAHVHVYLAGVEVSGSPYTLTSTGSTQVALLSYAAGNGPLKIVSDQNIVAAERVNYFVDGAVTSYSEMMGLPNLQLDTAYWFPWYKNDSQINTQLRFGVP